MSWCTSEYSILDAKEWASSASEAWEKGTDYRFLIEDFDTGKILGSVGINQVVPQHKIGNLGYWVRSSVLGNGVCSSAAKQAVVYAFKELGFQRIEIHIHPDNKASNAVAIKIGAMYEGVFRNKILFNGLPVSAKCYSIIPDDYKV